MAKFLSKTERDIKEADARIKVLLQMFGNYLLNERGIKEPVNQKELNNFEKLLNK